jgi:hypothetical protein
VDSDRKEERRRARQCGKRQIRPKAHAIHPIVLTVSACECRRYEFS